MPKPEHLGLGAEPRSCRSAARHSRCASRSTVDMGLPRRHRHRAIRDGVIVGHVDLGRHPRLTSAVTVASKFVVVERQRGDGGARPRRDIVPAHPRPPTLVGIPAVVADHVAHHPRVSPLPASDQLGKAIGFAIRRARQPCVAPPLDHHVGLAAAVALQSHPQCRPLHRADRARTACRTPSRGGEHLGVGRRDEALIGIDRDDLAPVVVQHDQPEARPRRRGSPAPPRPLSASDGARCARERRRRAQQEKRYQARAPANKRSVSWPQR